MDVYLPRKFPNKKVERESGKKSFTTERRREYWWLGHILNQPLCPAGICMLKHKQNSSMEQSKERRTTTIRAPRQRYIHSEQNKKDTNLLGKHSRFARCEICICTNWEHIVDHLGRVGKLIIGFSIESIVFCDRKIERSIGSWKRSNHSQDRSREIFFKDWRDQFDHGRSSLDIGKIVRSKDQIPNPANWYYDHGWAFWSSVFQSNWSFFVTERSIWSGKISNHCRRSFLKINGINLFTVDLFKRSTGSIPSRSIY